MKLESLSDQELEKIKQSHERMVARYNNLQLATKVSL